MRVLINNFDFNSVKKLKAFWVLGLLDHVVKFNPACNKCVIWVFLISDFDFFRIKFLNFEKFVKGVFQVQITYNPMYIKFGEMSNLG